MAISYPLSSPAAFGVATVTWGPMTNTARAKAPWTFKDLVQVFAGEMWTATIEILPQTEADGRRLAAWLVSLQGQRGTFLLGDPAARTPLGSAGGAPQVDGAGQSGSGLNVSGLPASAAAWLKAGDYFQLGAGAASRLYMALADVDADPIGKATIDLWPALRSSPATGAAIVVHNPQGVFALATPLNQWHARPALIYDGVVLDAMEIVA